MNSLRSFFNYRLLIILSSCFIFGCSVSDSLDSDYSKWDFSGSVVDANSNQGLSGVTITYQNTSGEKTEAKTDKNGFFFIDALPYGTRSFTFSYKKISGKDTLYYTSKTINVTSTNESSHMEGVVAGTSAVVRLSPINASLTGEFYIKDEDSGKNLPVSDVELSIVYYDTSFINLFPENLSATTDSDGRFKFKGLPADTGFILQVKSFSDKDLHYTAKDIALPRLKADAETNLGRMFLDRDTTYKKNNIIKSSNVIDANMNGYSSVSTLLTPYYVFNEKISDKNLSVSVMADTNVFYVKPKLSNDTLYLKHDLAFPSETKIVVSITAYKKSSGDRIALELSGDSAFTTDRGLYAVTSNAWPSNKKFKATFGIDDTIWVKFSETLDPNTDRIQWNYATGMARTIYANGYYANAKSWVKKDTLFVKMLEKILDSRVQGDSVGMNVTVYAQNEMYIKGFMLRTELEVPPTSSSSEASSSSSATSASTESSSSVAMSSSSAVSSSSATTSSSSVVKSSSSNTTSSSSVVKSSSSNTTSSSSVVKSSSSNTTSSSSVAQSSSSSKVTEPAKVSSSSANSSSSK